MKTTLRRCQSCSRYTLKDVCPACGATAVTPLPARYSPEDRYGEYRRRARKEVSHGRHRDDIQ